MSVILAIETSCDDTAAAVVKKGTHVIAATRHTQNEHNQYGGVVPEIAARAHSDTWRKVLENCLEAAKIRIDDIDALAVTEGPGLQTSLLNGTTAASFLSLSLNKPLIPVHHLYGHICSNFLERKISDILFPSIVLVASGGHTQLYYWQEITTIKKIGDTLDDAAGEAFDKTAKMLGLGYPGGPIVSKLAREGDETKFAFPRILLKRDSLDFSFSGLKAAVYRAVEKQKKLESKISHQTAADICASFQTATTETFCKKITRAIEKYPKTKMLHFVGGVSSNVDLCNAFETLCQKRGMKFLKPTKPEFSTDNAAMIASAAYFLLKKDPNAAKIQFIDGNPKLPFYP